MRRILAIIALLVLAFGPVAYAAMHATLAGRLTDPSRCAPIGNLPALCQNLGEHVSLFETEIASSFPASFFLLLLPLLSVAGLVSLALELIHSARDGASLRTRHPLQELFSSGILHPKLH